MQNKKNYIILKSASVLLGICCIIYTSVDVISKLNKKKETLLIESYKKAVITKDYYTEAPLELYSICFNGKYQNKNDIGNNCDITIPYAMYVADMFKNPGACYLSWACINNFYKNSRKKIPHNTLMYFVSLLKECTSEKINDDINLLWDRYDCIKILAEIYSERDYDLQDSIEAKRYNDMANTLMLRLEQMDIPEKYSAFNNFQYVHSMQTYVCIPVKYTVESRMDSSIVCCDAKMLSKACGVNIRNKEEHYNHGMVLFEACKKNTAIHISEKTLNKISNNIVREIPDIQSLYDRQGLSGLLGNVKETNMYKLYRNDRAKFNYIAYLLWQNDIFMIKHNFSKTFYFIGDTSLLSEYNLN